jgi:hypothetical protein
MNDAKQAGDIDIELKRIRKTLIEETEKLKRKRAIRQILSLVFEVSGYAILLYIDWRIALAVLLIGVARVIYR